MLFSSDLIYVSENIVLDARRIVNVVTHTHTRIHMRYAPSHRRCIRRI